MGSVGNVRGLLISDSLTRVGEGGNYLCDTISAFVFYNGNQKKRDYS